MRNPTAAHKPSCCLTVPVFGNTSLVFREGVWLLEGARERKPLDWATPGPLPVTAGQVGWA